MVYIIKKVTSNFWNIFLSPVFDARLKYVKDKIGLIILDLFFI